MDFVEINGFSTYKINMTGDVINSRGNVLKKNISNGYPQISLYKKGKTYKRMLHRILAYHFIPNPDDLKIVNHKDGNKLNYKLENLEWCTKKHNTKHAIETGLIKRRPVSQYTIDGTLVKNWDHSQQASKHLNIKYQLIYNACRRGNITGGFKWKFTNNEKVRPSLEYIKISGEIWKKNGNYGISNMGRVWTYYYNRLISPYKNNGYILYAITVGKKRKHYKAHRLVAENFIPNPKGLGYVNHKDGNKQNNNIENLEWTTCSENILHALETGLINTKSRWKPVKSIDPVTKEVVKKYDSLTQAVNDLNLLSTSNISTAIKCGTRSGGFLWEFAS